MVAIEGGYNGHDGINPGASLVDFLPDIAIETGAVRPRRPDARAVRIRGHGAGSDTPLDEALRTPAEWRDAKCVWWGNYGPEAEALQAVGLRE